MNPLQRDINILFKDVPYKVVSSTADDDTLLENSATGERTFHKTWNLMQAYVQGDLLTSVEARKRDSSGAMKKRPPARMDGMSEAARTETRRRIDYLVRLENRGGFSGNRKALRAHLSDIAHERKEARAPHASTVFRWRRKYLNARNDVRALFARFDLQGGKGGSRLQPEVEAILDSCIDRIVLGQKTFSAEDVRDAASTEILLRNQTRTASDKLKVPSLRTTQRRIQALWAYEVTAAKYGKREADRRFASLENARAVSRVLEIVEIDHTPVDVLITDDQRKDAIARPMITVVLDRMSRCVLGYHLSAAGYGTAAVFEAIRHALLPKTYLTSPGRYADLDLEWPCWGWPETILMDNGREFHADAITDTLLALAITAEFSASRSPNDKPHIERFLRTLNYGLIHKLPGTTLSKVHKRIGYKAEEEASLTLEELDKIIHVWICNVYHRRPHAGLGGLTPLEVWKTGAQAHPPQLKLNKRDLDIELGEHSVSAVQHYGIDLNTFVYRSGRLLTLRGMLPADTKVAVKWTKNDVGHVWVWDQIQQEYFKADNTKSEFKGLTLEQAKALKKSIATSEADQQPARAAGGQAIRAMVADAMEAKSLKVRKAGKSSREKDATGSAAEHGDAEDLDADLDGRDHEGEDSCDFEFELTNARGA
jgi:putative transposase